MMTRMGTPRLRAAGAAAVVVSLASACSTTAPPRETETPAAAALRVRTVTGADRLDERHRYRRLDDSVQLALHLSYQCLPGPRQTLLRLLSGHPGQDLDDHAAAALLDADIEGTGMAGANTLSATLQQLAGGLGVAVGALLLRTGEHLVPGGDTGGAAYAYAFGGLALIMVVPLVQAWRLPPTSGAELAARR